MVREVPRGKVVTYGQIARLIGFPRLARQVGYAMAALPEKSDVPWFRVINAKGECSQSYGEDRQEQLRRLKAEGVRADDQGRIDLKRYQWAPPGTAP